MKNLERLIETMQSDLRFRDKVLDSKPVTASGLQLKENWSKMFDNGKQMSFNTANIFLKEAFNITKVDPEINYLYKSVFEYLSGSKIKSTLAIVAENNSKLGDSDINRVFKNDLDSLLGESETEVLSLIRNGRLNKYSANPSIASVIEMVNKGVKVVDSKLTEISNPVSFYETVDDSTFIRLHDYVLELTEGDVNISTRPKVSEKFKYVSELVHRFECNEGKFEFDLSFGKFEISEDGLKQYRGEELIEVSSNEFLHNSKLIIESKGLDKNYINYVDAIIALTENFDSITIANNFYEVTTKHMNESVTLINHDSVYGVLVAKSKRLQLGFQKFNKISEAVSRVEFLTGVNLSEKFKEELESEQKVTNEQLTNIDEKRSGVEKLESKLQEIVEEIKLVDSGSDSHKKLLEVYDIVKDLISDKKTELVEALKS